MLLWTRSVAKEFGSLFKLTGSGARLFVEGGTLGYFPVSPASWFHLQERGASPSHSPLEQPDCIHPILFLIPQGVWFCRHEPELFVSWQMESRRKGSQRSSAPKRKGVRTQESSEEEVPMRMRSEGERRSKTRQDPGKKGKARELTPPPKRRRADMEVLNSPSAVASDA